MKNAELAQLEHDNFIEALANIAAIGQNTVVDRSDGVALIASGSPLRLFNQVLIESDDADAGAIVRAVATTRARGDNFVVNLRVGTDDDFIPLTALLGLVPVSETPWMPGMAMYPIAAAAPPMPDGHEIGRVTSESDLEAHIRTTALGFGMPEEWVRGFMSPAMLKLPGITVYTGHANGQPVTTGVGVRSGRTIGVYNISTVPEARRQGYGEQMTWRIVADGVREGCDVSILQASDMGFPIYQRMGYRTVVRYMGYIDPPTEPEA